MATCFSSLAILVFSYLKVKQILAIFFEDYYLDNLLPDKETNAKYVIFKASYMMYFHV